MNHSTIKRLAEVVSEKHNRDIEGFFRNWLYSVIPEVPPWLVDKFIYEYQTNKRSPFERLKDYKDVYMEDALKICKELTRLSDNIQLEEYYRKQLYFLLNDIGHVLMDTVFLAYNFKNFVEKENSK